MSDDWQTFICEMGDNLASIMVDTGISRTINHVPGDLAVLVLTYKAPDENGLPTQAEFDAVKSVEGELEKFVAFGRDAYVGRITKEGVRIFFTYTRRDESRWEVLRSQLIERSGYEIALRFYPDPEHEDYWHYLYPTPDDWRVIRDTEVVELLKRNGDDLDAKRRIEHWSYFPDERSAQAFIEWAMSDPRFTHDEQYSGPTDDGRHCVRLAHVGNTRQRSVSHHTIALRKKAEELGGKYDGWETEVIQKRDV